MKTGKTYGKFRELLRSPYADLTPDECYALSNYLKGFAIGLSEGSICRPKVNPNHKPNIVRSKCSAEVALNERNH